MTVRRLQCAEPMRRAKKKLRSPFVVSISAAVAASAAFACGGGVAPVDNLFSNEPQPPPTPPTNPPGPGGPLGTGTCPTTKVGDPCNAEGDRCTGGCSGGGCQCFCGEWIGLDMSGGCNPPSTTCPASEPVAGTSCYATTPSCSYADACETKPDGTPAQREYSCTKGTWQRTSADYVAACPATMPAIGSPCTSCEAYPSRCEYAPPPNSPCPGPAFACDPKTGTWISQVSTCNPPGPIVDAGHD